MHYRLAKIATSSSYIGVPAELLASAPSTVPADFPAWRKSMTKRDTLYPIPNTAQMNGIVDAGDASRQIGRNPQDIDTWNGFAADSTSLWGVAMGGHNGQWSNKVVKDRPVGGGARLGNGVRRKSVLGGADLSADGRRQPGTITSMVSRPRGTRTTPTTSLASETG